MPNIPDKLYKLSILIGLFLIGFSWLKSNESYKEYSAKYEKYDNYFDSLKLLDEEIAFKQDLFISRCSEVEIKHNIDSICYNEDDEIFFNKPLSSEPSLKTDVLILEKEWFRIKELQHKKELLNIKLEDSSAEHDEANEDLAYWADEFDWLKTVGFIFTGFGLALWFIDENVKPEERKKQFDKIYNSCQSCGNNFSSVRRYGKNQDGTFNLGLCNECYDDGDFVESDRYCEKHEIKRRISKNRKRRFFDKLERWNH
jgi:ribosomal protein S14